MAGPLIITRSDVDGPRWHVANLWQDPLTGAMLHRITARVCAVARRDRCGHVAMLSLLANGALYVMPASGLAAEHTHRDRPEAVLGYYGPTATAEQVGEDIQCALSLLPRPARCARREPARASGAARE